MQQPGKHTKTGAKVELHKKFKTALQQELSYTLILIYQHYKTAWQHTKTSAEVELHVDSHLTTLPGSTPKQVQELSYTLILI